MWLGGNCLLLPVFVFWVSERVCCVLVLKVLWFGTEGVVIWYWRCCVLVLKVLCIGTEGVVYWYSFSDPRTKCILCLLMCMVRHASVHWERERERESRFILKHCLPTPTYVHGMVWESERVREWERESVCVCVRVCTRASEREIVWERLCEREWEREWERERLYVQSMLGVYDLCAWDGACIWR